MTPPHGMKPDQGGGRLVPLGPGQAVGRYKIEALLGGGIFGMSYRARDARLGCEVVIKEFLPPALATREGDGKAVPRSKATSDEFTRGRRHFLNEGRMLTSLQHAPCVVRVLDCLEANDTAYIVMEQVPGIALERRLKEGNLLSPADLDRILWPLLESLERVHRRGFFHGDINPANIVLDANGRPTLIDFGAARTPAAAPFTPAYAAPEQISAGKQGPWTDIYSLAATFYHVLVGRPPPSARERMPEDCCPPLRELKPAGFTAGMLAGIDRGLALRIADRPQSIVQWRSILWQTGKFKSGAAPAPAADQEEVPSPSIAPAFRPPRPPRPQASTGADVPPPGSDPAASAEAPPRRSTRPLWVGVAVGSTLALGCLTYFMFAIPSAEPTAATASIAAKTSEIERQRAEKAAHEKADAEASARHQQEQEARAQEIAVETAAIRKQLEADFKMKEQAAAEARRRAEAANPKLAQAVEAALNLTLLDREHIQVALGALGFDPRGVDGVFGPRTRQMIAAWQKSRNDPPSGLLDATQKQALLRGGATAVAAFDARQKKLAQAAATASPYDGEYVGTADVAGSEQPVSVRVVAGKASGQWKVEGCGTATFHLSITSDGSAALDLNSYTPQCEPTSRRYGSQLDSNSLQFNFARNDDTGSALTLTRQQ